MAEKKLLELQFERVEGISSKTNKEYAFNSYYVLVNGIRLNLIPKDTTVSQVLDQYYREEE